MNEKVNINILIDTIADEIINLEEAKKLTENINNLKLQDNIVRYRNGMIGGCNKLIRMLIEYKKFNTGNIRIKEMTWCNDLDKNFDEIDEEVMEAINKEEVNIEEYYNMAFEKAYVNNKRNRVEKDE